MRYLWLMLALLFVGCEVPPQESSLTKNGAQVQFLFEHDGIRVYRFSDGGNNIYFTSTTGTTWRQHSNDTSRPMSVNK